MNVIERINMLKKMAKEAGNIVAWQVTIYTALHNIHADWIVSGTVAWARLVANFPRTIAVLLSDHNLAHHGLGTVVPHDALANLTERAFSSLTGRWALSQAHRGALNKIMVFKGPDADPVEEDKPTVPSGLIVMWHGLIANIPSGWVICDGNSGTPNLLAKFVEGVATAVTNPGATGGAVSKTTSGHYHAQRIGSFAAFGAASLPVRCSAAYGGYTRTNTVAGTGVDLASMITGVASETDSISDIRPPFYDIVFLMKT